MAEPATASKRPPPEDELTQDAPEQKRKKFDSAPILNSSEAEQDNTEIEPNNTIAVQPKRRNRTYHDTLAKLLGRTLKDDGSIDLSITTEGQRISRQLERGTHSIIFEYNNGHSAKCRAESCLVEPLQYAGDRIRGQYRFLVQAVQPDESHWSQRVTLNNRYFHVPCLEATGVDINKHLLVNQTAVDRCEGVVLHQWTVYFHAAISQWVNSKGKAFDADLLQDYDEALREYRKNAQTWDFRHRCKAQPCACPERPMQPDMADFITGVPSKRTLTEVLIQVLKADHLLYFLAGEDVLRILEIHRQVPPGLTVAAIEAKVAKISGSDTAGTQKDQAQDHQGGKYAAGNLASTQTEASIKSDRPRQGAAVTMSRGHLED